MQEIRQSTACTIVLGPIVDAADGVTAHTTAIANTDIRLHKEGGTTFGNKSTGSSTHREDGFHTASFDATDTNTDGKLTVNVSVTGEAPYRLDLMVLSQGAYDAKYPNTGNGVRANLIQWASSAVATPTVAGVPEVDVTHNLGSAAVGGGGILKTNVQQWLGNNVANTVAGRPLVDVGHVGGVAEDLPTATALATVDGVVDAILVDTGTTLDGKIDAIDAIADSILVDTGTTIPGLIAALDAVVDTVKAETALIVADTSELQTDDVPGLIAALDAVVDTVKAETALIVADTNELQSDDVPGLISALDTVVDGIPALVMAEAVAEPSNTDETFTGLTVEKVLGLLHAASILKITFNRSTGAFTLFKEDGITTLLSGTDTDDGTTYTRVARS